MTALSDALAVAQARAIAAVSKAYIAEAIDGECAVAKLQACGIVDPVDTAQLLACLDVAREWGTGTAAVNGATAKPTEPISEKQRNYIAKLADERGQVAPDFEGLTQTQGSEIIDQLKAGTYDPDKWKVPF